MKGLTLPPFLVILSRFRKSASARAVGVWKRSGRPDPVVLEGWSRRPGAVKPARQVPEVAHFLRRAAGTPDTGFRCWGEETDSHRCPRVSPPWRAMRAGSGETEPAFPFRD